MGLIMVSITISFRLGQWMHSIISRRIALLALVLLAMLPLFSCGGKSSSTVGPVSKITVTPSTASVGVTQQQTFFAAPVDSNGNTVNGLTITWTSSAAGIATIDAGGIALGKAPGSTQITASASGITSNTATLNVTSNVAKVVISPMTAAVSVNGTQQFTAVAQDSSGATIPGIPISWFCSFAGIAAIDQNGLATGVAPGTVTIVASAGSVNSQPATLTVNP